MLRYMTHRRTDSHHWETRFSLILSMIVASSVGHFLLPDYAHGLHAAHIVLAGTFLLPIIACAIWFDFADVVLTATIISAVYFAYMQVRWANQPMENANQWAFIAGYWVVALLAGSLVRLNRAEQARHRLAERRSTMEALDSLSAALRARDEYTRKHSQHVADLAAKIADSCGMAPEKVELVGLAGLVHDLGKVGIRDDVLLKPGSLSQEERRLMEQHPVVAAEILSKIPAASEIAALVLAHHECPDGSGYPFGLPASQIPEEAKILRVADVFCSLIEERPYKPGLEIEAALDLMRGWSGTKIDQRSFEALLRLLPQIRASF